MEIAPLVAALETLRAQHKDVVADEQQLTAELELMRGVRRNLETAMKSIETLVSDPSTWKSPHPGDRNAPKVTVRVAEPSELLENAVAQSRNAEEPPPPAGLEPYLGVGGKRLKSKRMLFDLLQKVPELVTREELKRLFFEHYGRENLERYWARPDNALNTAIDRAVTGHVIEELPNTSGGPPYYAAGWRNSDTGEPAFPVHGEDD
jgi:hypothetical protein